MPAFPLPPCPFGKLAKVESEIISCVALCRQAGLHPSASAETTEKLLDAAGLEEHKTHTFPPKTYSGDEALSHSPTVINKMRIYEFILRLHL